MMKAILCSFLILLLVPFSQAFSAETTDNAPTLAIVLNNENIHVYQDSEGYTVVVGIVDNTSSLTPVTNVNIQASFYDALSPTPLEIAQGTTTLEVIPPNGRSSFSIRSDTPNPNISEASVFLLGDFTSSNVKEKGLTVSSSEIFLDTSLKFSGVLQNSAAQNTDTKVHLAFYDAFEPPRILRVSTIDIGKVSVNDKVDFNFNEVIDPGAVGFYLFAESNIFISDFVDVKIPPAQIPDKLITFSKVSVEDFIGNKLSELEVGSAVNIKSETLIEFAADQKSDETAYTYYVQIKESGEIPYVEYIGKFDGRFIGTGKEIQSVDWIPENPGLFYIETFVWDRNNVPIAEQGPFVLVIVK